MADEFLDLYAVDPAAGRSRALSVIQESRDAAELAFAHRALGVSCRDSGDIDGAWRHLSVAARYAQRTSDSAVIADVLATRGGTRVILGSARAGLRDLAAAAEYADGPLLGSILYRRGLAHLLMGDPLAAVADVERAVELLKDSDDTAWLSRSIQVLGEAQIQLGHPRRAAEHFAECLALLGDDAGYERARLRIMQAWLTFLMGDLPAALEMFSVGEIATIDDGRLRAEVATRLATIHLAAGLRDRALDCLELLGPDSVPPSAAAHARAMLSRVQFFGGSMDAHETARGAAVELRRMGYRLEAAEAELTVIEAEARAGAWLTSFGVAERTARDLEVSGSRLAVDAWLLAGRIGAEKGMSTPALRAFSGGAAFRRSPDRLVASSGWMARALELELNGKVGVLRACGRGLDALDEYREIIGSSEMRASITARGHDLARLALRHAAHDPRNLLRWSERWRATALAQPPVTPRGELSEAVALLRDSGRRIAEARQAGESTEALERERRSLERKVRAEHHQQRAEGGRQNKRFDAAELVEKVGDGAFLQIVDVDGILHVLVVSKGRVRRVIASETTEALELADAGRFALRRAARTGRFAPGDLGRRFQDAVLGDAARMLPDGPVTISPTAALHGAPFALMPALATRPFSIVPSAAQWMRALAVPVPRTKRRALISGPGLLTGGAEVARLAAEYPDATVLRDADATVSNAMKAIDGAKLAHLATHGTFRADSPLFSALEMSDGPLSVYELERLKRAPYRTILSACDSGVLAPVGAQEVLGLASALFSLGSAGLVCSIAEVNDEATADIMMQVHSALEAKRPPAEGLAMVRESGSPIERATAAAFVALGV